jgi:hypothetical protein
MGKQGASLPLRAPYVNSGLIAVIPASKSTLNYEEYLRRNTASAAATGSR